MEIKIGEKYTPDEVIQFCKEKGLTDLAKRIEKDKEHLDLFVSDGCSWWPDSIGEYNYSECCILHDIKYWVGGTEADRLEADLQLAICVNRIAGPIMAEVMLAGVRGAGPLGELIKASWRWGYGRKETRKVLY